MTQHDPTWPRMTRIVPNWPKCPKLTKMPQNGPIWPQMTQSDQKWPKVTQNDQTWPKKTKNDQNQPKCRQTWTLMTKNDPQTTPTTQWPNMTQKDQKRPNGSKGQEGWRLEGGRAGSSLERTVTVTSMSLGETSTIWGWSVCQLLHLYCPLQPTQGSAIPIAKTPIFGWRFFGTHRCDMPPPRKAHERHPPREWPPPFRPARLAGLGRKGVKERARYLIFLPVEKYTETLKGLNRNPKCLPREINTCCRIEVLSLFSEWWVNWCTKPRTCQRCREWSTGLTREVIGPRGNGCISKQQVGMGHFGPILAKNTNWAITRAGCSKLILGLNLGSGWNCDQNEYPRQPTGPLDIFGHFGSFWGHFESFWSFWANMSQNTNCAINQARGLKYQFGG